MHKDYETMTDDQLKAERDRLKDNLCDIEDTHAFTFGKTSVHIGAEQAQNMQLEYEEECRSYNERIAAVEKVMKDRGLL